MVGIAAKQVQGFEVVRIVEVFWVVKVLKGEGIAESAFQFQCVEVCRRVLCGEVLKRREEGVPHWSFWFLCLCRAVEVLLCGESCFDSEE